MVPYTDEQTARVKENDVKFVHYTSAASALKILESQSIILRNASIMNDFSEVQHGLDCLASSYNGMNGERLKNLMKAVQDDLPEIFESDFNDNRFKVQFGTYLFSMSEHGGDFEDAFGRLSMWRAYAPKDGVAFVFNNRPFLSETRALGASSSPVFYGDARAYEPLFSKMVDNIEANIDLLKLLGGAAFYALLTNAFRFSVQSTKHPAFLEEREWRIIYAPNFLHEISDDVPTLMSRMPERTLTIGGVPQKIYSIPFVDYPDEGFIGATAPDLLEKILIGPTQDAFVIYDTLVDQLEKLGVRDAEQKIVMTGIPLRL
jgi:Protein of unknown function (DUF2971)